jgi:hypothetical protein
VPFFADRGCHVVSVTDPYGSILGFLDRIDTDIDIQNCNYEENNFENLHQHTG